jgi:hypothetical protein
LNRDGLDCDNPVQHPPPPRQQQVVAPPQTIPLPRMNPRREDDDKQFVGPDYNQPEPPPIVAPDHFTVQEQQVCRLKDKYADKWVCI